MDVIRNAKAFKEEVKELGSKGNVEKTEYMVAQQ